MSLLLLFQGQTGGGTTTISPPAGSLVFVGYAPTVFTGTQISAPAGLLTLTGYAPTITQLGWVVIDDSQGGTWVLIDDAQGGSWTNIDDSQSQGWTIINTV